MAETETGWTKEFPRVDGYYWLRFGSDDKNPMPVRYDSGYLHEIGVADDMRWLRDINSAEFLPASPADFEQLTRLREIAKGALQFRVEVNGPCNHEEYMTKLCTQCEIREALAQRNTGGK